MENLKEITCSILAVVLVIIRLVADWRTAEDFIAVMLAEELRRKPGAILEAVPMIGKC